MRAEVKVGLIVGLVAIAGAGIWWFSRSTNELGEVPFDRAALDEKPSGETALASDSVPTASDRRAADRPTPRRAERTTPTATPGRRATPTPGLAERAEGTPEKPAVTPLSPEPGSSAARITPRTEEPGGPAGRAPGAEPGQPSPGQAPPGDMAVGGDVTGTKTTEAGATEAGTPAGPAPSVTPPRRRSTPVAPQVPARGSYVIQPGDRLIDIARYEYDDGTLWRAIKAANPDIDENALQIGQTIQIPSRAEALRLSSSGTTPAQAAPAAPARRTEPSPDASQADRATYVVERGDSLIKIARNVLNDEARWEEIYELNRDQLTSPHLLRIGMELRLPPLRRESAPSAAGRD